MSKEGEVSPCLIGKGWNRIGRKSDHRKNKERSVRMNGLSHEISRNVSRKEKVVTATSAKWGLYGCEKTSGVLEDLAECRPLRPVTQQGLHSSPF